MKILVQNFAQGIGDILASPIFHVGKTPVSLTLILQVILILLGIVLLFRSLKNVLKQYLLARLGIDEGNREAIATIISYALGAFSFVLLLQAFGVNLASLAVLVGALGVGIGFGLQDFMRDFVSGLSLLLERNIKVGDFVELGTEESFHGITGLVRIISLRSAIVETRDGAKLVVPNNRLVAFPVINWGKHGSEFRMIVPVKVGRESDCVLATEVLLNTAYGHPEILKSPSPRVCLTGVQEDFFEIELHVWAQSMWESEYIRSDLYFNIEYDFRHYGIHFLPSYQDMIIAIENPEVIDPTGSYKARKASSLYPLQKQVSDFLPKSPYIRDLLRQVKYFSNFNDLELLHLIEAGNRCQLFKSETLFRESDPGDAFYIVLSGKVGVYAEKLGKHLATLESGHFFGELSLMLGMPRTATITAIEDSLLFAIDHRGFERLLREYPQFAKSVIQELARHREELAARQEEMRNLGLIDEVEDDKNPVDWARKRLRRLFLLTES